MPSHSHGLSHIGVQTTIPSYNNWESNVGGSSSSLYLASGSTNDTGGGQAHNNLQPYMTTNYIIKAFQSAGIVAEVVNEESDSTTNTYSANFINNKIEELKTSVISDIQTAVYKNIVKNTWSDALNNGLTVNLEAGKYICVLSVAISKEANTEEGVATIRPRIDNTDLGVTERSTIPVPTASLMLTVQVVFYKEFTEGYHTIMPQVYCNAGPLLTSSARIVLYKIG